MAEEKSLISDLDEAKSKVELFSEKLKVAKDALAEAQASLLASDEKNSKSFANLVGDVRDRIGDVDVITNMLAAAMVRRDAANIELLKFRAGVAEKAAKNARGIVLKNRSTLDDLIRERRVLLNNGLRNLGEVEYDKKRIELETRIATLKINGDGAQRKHQRAKHAWDQAEEQLGALTRAE